MVVEDRGAKKNTKICKVRQLMPRTVVSTIWVPPNVRETGHSVRQKIILGR
jgi:hypothetical protein